MPLELLDLPRDCLGSIVERLDPQSLKRFGAASKTCRRLADRRFASAEYGRALFASQFRRWRDYADRHFPWAIIAMDPFSDNFWVYGEEPAIMRHMSQFPDQALIWLNYRLGLLLLRPLWRRCRAPHGTIDVKAQGTPEESAMKASGALLLEWAATFERGGLGGGSPPRSPRREVLALIRRDEVVAAQALMDLAGRWRAGYNAARACLALVACGETGCGSGYAAARRDVAALMQRALASGRLTPDRLVLVYCIWRLANLCTGRACDCEARTPTPLPLLRKVDPGYLTWLERIGMPAGWAAFGVPSWWQIRVDGTVLAHGPAA